MEPFVFELVEVTLNLDGLGVDVAEIDEIDFLCGMRDGFASSGIKEKVLDNNQTKKGVTTYQYCLETMMNHVVMVA